MISETFTDTYGTTFTLRKIRPEDTHVQLLMTYADRRSEQTSYGFTESDFARFATVVVAVDQQVSEAAAQ